MTGHPHQKANIQPNGKIVWPLAGTIHWVDGKATGVWGKDLKIVPMIMTKGGKVRALNAMERILYAVQIEGVRP